MMFCAYPNLELVEYKVKQVLSADDGFTAKLGKQRHAEFDLFVFPQVWGSTCTGFDLASDGTAAIGGCAMTKAYTTVVHELVTDTYVVCFGDKPCYKVTHANERFFSDLRERNMASLSSAKELY